MVKNKKKSIFASQPDVKTENKQTDMLNQDEVGHISDDNLPDNQSGSDQSEIEKEVEKLKNEVEELKDKNLRMMAEFDNYRRRTNKEKLDLMSMAGTDIFKDMLPLIDDFERAIDATTHLQEGSIKQVQEGIELIYKKFLTFLSNHNIEVIETDGQDFSTDLHEAMKTIEAGEENVGKIVECVQKGYKMGDKVIRFAKVVVGK